MGQLHREPAGEQGRQDGVDVGEGGGTRRSSFLEDARRPRVAKHHLPGGHHVLT